MDLLKSLWTGDLNLQLLSKLPEDDDYLAKVESINKIMKNINERFYSEQIDLFNSFVKKNEELPTIVKCDCFIIGFKTALVLLIEVLTV